MSYFKYTNHINHQESGQSLVEVIVAVGIIVVTIVGLISSNTLGLNNAQFARNKALAAKYAQEAIEWLRTQRDQNWNTFYTSAGTATYCLKTTAWTQRGACATTDVINDQYDIFVRQVSLSRPAVDRVIMTVSVSWPEGARTTSISVTSHVTKWK